MNINTILARLVSAILSWAESSSLRDRVYSQSQRIEILETALDDIERINSAGSHPNTLVQGIVTRTRSKK